jgi:hypothetical protein
VCHWFTYLGDLNGCVLFRDCIEFDSDDCDNCFSGEVDCQPLEPECGIVGQCLGLLDYLSGVINEDECLDRCKYNSKCTWYTFETQTNICEEFRNCPQIDETCSTCISGERNCDTSKNNNH